MRDEDDYDGRFARRATPIGGPAVVCGAFSVHCGDSFEPKEKPDPITLLAALGATDVMVGNSHGEQPGHADLQLPLGLSPGDIRRRAADFLIEHLGQLVDRPAGD